jgi:2-C-methyl-D-erythritol 4-phosphate cytidylyltransferase
VQTPQAFRTELLRRAHEEVSEDVPDDAAMIEKIGGRVALFEGPRSNIKITSADDFALVEALMRSSTSA